MKKKAAGKGRAIAGSIDAAVEEALAWLKDASSKKVREGMARFGIPSDKALGVPMGEIRNFAATFLAPLRGVLAHRCDPVVPLA